MMKRTIPVKLLDLIVPGFLTHIYVLNGIAVAPVFSRFVSELDKVLCYLRSFLRCTLMISLSYLTLDRIYLSFCMLTIFC